VSYSLFIALSLVVVIAILLWWFYHCGQRLL
jgi:hypothetical protein